MSRDNGQVRVDKKIPLPTNRGRGKWPWNELEVGDSFLMPDGRGGHLITYANLRFAPKHFTQRKVAEGVRVWRDK